MTRFILTSARKIRIDKPYAGATLPAADTTQKDAGQKPSPGGAGSVSHTGIAQVAQGSPTVFNESPALPALLAQSAVYEANSLSPCYAGNKRNASAVAVMAAVQI